VTARTADSPNQQSTATTGSADDEFEDAVAELPSDEQFRPAHPDSKSPSRLTVFQDAIK